MWGLVQVLWCWAAGRYAGDGVLVLALGTCFPQNRVESDPTFLEIPQPHVEAHLSLSNSRTLL